MIDSIGVLNLAQTPELKQRRLEGSTDAVDPKQPQRSEVGDSRSSFHRVLSNKTNKPGIDRDSQEDRPTKELERKRNTSLPDRDESSALVGLFRAPVKAEIFLDAVLDESTDEAKGLGIASIGDKINSTKSEVLREFMDSMESDFGIRPQRLLRAMASLDAEDLLAPPEMSSGKIIDELHLTKPQGEAAEKLYLDMLSRVDQLEAMDSQSMMDSRLQQKQAGSGRNLSAVLGLLRSEDIDRDITQIGRKFFDVKSFPQGNSVALPVGASNIEGSELVSNLTNEMKPSMSVGPSVNGEGRVELPQPTSLENIHPSQIGMSGGSESTNGLYNLEGSRGPRVQLIDIGSVQENSNGSELRDLQEAQGFDRDIAEALGLSVLGTNPGETGQRALKSYLATSTSAGQLIGKVAGAQDQPLASADIDGEDGESESANSESLSQGHYLMSPSQSPKNEGVFTLTQATVAALPASQNIDEIVRQSQVLVKDGGGEMKIQLKPEGLGEIGLKVSVADGKVNVQLTTDSIEARRHLEANIQDLRSSLEQQKLHVEQVRVDVSSNLMDDFARDRGNSEGRLAQQEFAREFLQNFRDSNQSRKDGFFEATGLKGYRQRRRVEPRPIEDAAVTRQNRSDGGKSLYLVA